MNLIVCKKKRNQPQLDVRICEKKCSIKEDCKEYMEYLKRVNKENLEEK